MESTPDNVFGVVLIAVVLSAILYGVGIVQFWLYIRKYHSIDPILIQSMVLLPLKTALETDVSQPKVVTVLLCDTCQQALTTHATYRNLVTSMTNPSILTGVVNTSVIQLYFGGTAGTIVQQFFCWRIYKVGQSAVVPAIVSLASWVVFVLLYYTATKFGEVELPVANSLQTLVIVTNGLSAAVDVTITLTLVFLLNSVKTGFRQSTDLINRLMIFTFTTGIPTSIFALLSAICVRAFPQTQLFVFFYIILGRLYTNSLLVTLNSREYIRSGGTSGGGEQYGLELSAGNPRSQQHRDPISVRIRTDTEHDFERQDVK
ncbi:hypothetical protein C8R44DRAFT_983301 [Mycena epipterygia]|nr:hypothetical protein C8R44DRAFT_983301 [Mycena epipterygia]